MQEKYICCSTCCIWLPYVLPLYTYRQRSLHLENTKKVEAKRHRTIYLRLNTVSWKFTMMWPLVFTYSQSWGESTLQVVVDTGTKWFPTGDKGQPGCHVPHHVVSCSTHAILFRVQGKVLNKTQKNGLISQHHKISPCWQPAFLQQPKQ